MPYLRFCCIKVLFDKVVEMILHRFNVIGPLLQLGKVKKTFLSQQNDTVSSLKRLKSSF